MIPSFVKRLFGRLFKSPEQSVILYELVEMTPEKDVHLQGIRLLREDYMNVVVMVSPKISVKEESDGLHVKFDYEIVSNPFERPIDRSILTPYVGDCIIDIMKKDYH